MNGAPDLKSDPDPQAEPESLEQFLQRMRYRLKLVLRLCNIPSQDAEDLLQDTFVEVLRKWDTLYNKEGWVLGTLRYKCTKYWKDQRADPVEGMDPTALEVLCPPLPPLQEKQDEARDLHNLLRPLEKRHRQALWLRFALGFSPQEVADRLGYCPSSIRKLTLRSMSRIRRRSSRRAAPEPEVPDLDLD
ncbi:MAG: Sigma-70, region 4 [Acidobacteriota bacterium]|nr:Sigma-70, region 4 [Acidobacteriota bacterium]